MENRQTIMVAGWTYRQKTLAGLMTEKNDVYTWKKSEILDSGYYDAEDRIYQYEKAVYPLHIQAEPTNPHDPQAIMVFAGDTFVGYVPRGSFPELKSYAVIDGVECSVEIIGGRFKYFEHDEENDLYDSWDDKYLKLATDSTEYKAVMVFEW